MSNLSARKCVQKKKTLLEPGRLGVRAPVLQSNKETNAAPEQGGTGGLEIRNP